ncbi:hypothetical protein [Salinimicrobium sp. WS361]|uniref:hypothetical protein n=1 Tax=Salinimicrobium sp. WS361 TaxID=3425123 RepID=UPI003D6F72A4
MKYVLIFVLLFTSFTAVSQTMGEVEIQGSIKVPADAEAEGITIYNKTTGKGSVSTKGGHFTINASLNDSLYFSAVQYRDLLVVIDKNVLKTGVLQVEITEDINELAEVVIKPHNLTGNLAADLKNIPVLELELPTWSAAEIMGMDYSFSPDAQTGVTNPGMSANMEYGFQPIKIIGGLVDLVAPAPKNRSQEIRRARAGYDLLERELLNRYDHEFFQEVLKIDKEEILAFIAYLHKKGVSHALLEKENELQLLDLMVLQSTEFMKR